VGGAVISLLLTSMAWVLLKDWRLREQAVQEQGRQMEAMAASRDELRQSQESLRALHGHRSREVEEERKRIGQAIHDDLGQRLTVHRLHVDSVLEDALKSPQLASVVPPLERFKESIDSLFGSLREIANNLGPQELDMGLEVALHVLAQDFRDASGLRIALQTDLNAPAGGGSGAAAVGEALQIDVYRIVQEALTNVVRHAHATEVQVRVELQRAAVLLSVADDGIGMSSVTRDGQRAAGPGGHGYGLQGMRERAAAWGGSVEIGPAFEAEARQTARGTRIDVVLPLGPEIRNF
jgi:signal transduction histidine kinase